MLNAKRWLTVICMFAAATMVTLEAQTIPKPLKQRLVVGEPVWRELPVRDSLQGDYDRVWQTLLNTVLEHNFDIATMEKSSGYLRTTPNESIVPLKDNWIYKVQISLKMVEQPSDKQGVPGKVSKVRIQVAGDVTQIDTKTRGIRAYFRGYDQILLQSLFQDLQAKIGSV
jgi:hypothetical protein